MRERRQFAGKQRRGRFHSVFAALGEDRFNKQKKGPVAKFLKAALVLTESLARPLTCLTPTLWPTMQSSFRTMSSRISRRSFLKTSVALAGSAPLLATAIKAQVAGRKTPLMAYVGTFSSPLRDTPATQVDLPPGNGRGIHLFQVDRSTGNFTPNGVYELGTSPN